MKRVKTFSTILCTLAALLLCLQNLPAQAITEALQKQIWNAETPYGLDDWEVLLPSGDQDTVFHAGDHSAEVVDRDARGLPATVTVLARVAGHWVRQTRTEATFDRNGGITGLQSWTWDGSHWQDASRTTRLGDDPGMESVVELQYWEDGGWQTAHRLSSAMPMLGSTATNDGY